MYKTLALCSLLFMFSAFAPAQTWLKGTWTGSGYQIDTSETWTMRLKATGRKYSIDYPSLKCGGIWNLISANSTVATFREHITYGQDQCTNRGKVTIQKLNSHQIDFRYSNPRKTEIIASAILKKASR